MKKQFLPFWKGQLWLSTWEKISYIPVTKNIITLQLLLLKCFADHTVWKGNKASNLSSYPYLYMKYYWLRFRWKSINPPFKMESILKIHMCNRTTQNKDHIHLHSMCSHGLKMQNTLLYKRMARIMLRKWGILVNWTALKLNSNKCGLLT